MPRRFVYRDARDCWRLEVFTCIHICTYGHVGIQFLRLHHYSLVHYYKPNKSKRLALFYRLVRLLSPIGKLFEKLLHIIFMK